MTKIHLPTVLEQAFQTMGLQCDCQPSSLTPAQFEDQWGCQGQEYFATLTDPDHHKSPFKIWFTTDRNGDGDPENLYFCLTLIDNTEYRECYTVAEILTVYNQYKADPSYHR
jgi:hypothetical protein